MKVSMTEFAMGLIAAGVVAWLWGDELKRYADSRSRDFREKAADTLRSVQDTAERVFDTAQDQMHSTLQAGQEAIRPRVTGPLG